MDTKIVELYAVHQDDSDRHRGYPKWYFSNKYEAEKIAEGKGWYGGTAPISELNALKISCDEYLILKDVKPVKLGYRNEKEIRENALAKLTDEEKEVLGIKIKA